MEGLKFCMYWPGPIIFAGDASVVKALVEIHKGKRTLPLPPSLKLVFTELGPKCQREIQQLYACGKDQRPTLVVDASNYDVIAADWSKRRSTLTYMAHLRPNQLPLFSNWCQPYLVTIPEEEEEEEKEDCPDDQCQNEPDPEIKCTRCGMGFCSETCNARVKHKCV